MLPRFLLRPMTTMSRARMSETQISEERIRHSDEIIIETHRSSMPRLHHVRGTPRYET